MARFALFGRLANSDAEAVALPMAAIEEDGEGADHEDQRRP